MHKILLLFCTLILSGCASMSTNRSDPQRGINAQQGFSLKAKNSMAGVSDSSAVLIRIFKQESKLELWRETSNKKFVLVSSYDICSYSGTLGPKIKTGDYQSPEGLYNISHSHLNYHSSHFLSINVGFPNEFDRSHNRTGSYLMIHGGCSSAGCYAIGDQYMEELFAAVRDAMRYGQKQVQIQIYPFRLTDQNILKHKTNKNFDFWKQLKEGYDWFEKNQKPISFSVSNKKYLIKH